MRRLYVREKARKLEVKIQPIFTIISGFSKYPQEKNVCSSGFFSVNFLHWKELSGIGKTQNILCKSILDFQLSRNRFCSSVWTQCNTLGHPAYVPCKRSFTHGYINAGKNSLDELRRGWDAKRCEGVSHHKEHCDLLLFQWSLNEKRHWPIVFQYRLHETTSYSFLTFCSL